MRPDETFANHGVVVAEEQPVGSAIWQLAGSEPSSISVFADLEFAEMNKEWAAALIDEAGEVLDWGKGMPPTVFARYQPRRRTHFINMIENRRGSLSALVVPSTCEDQDALKMISWIGSQRELLAHAIIDGKRLAPILKNMPLASPWAYAVGFYDYRYWHVTYFFSESDSQVDEFIRLNPEPARYHFTVVERWGHHS